MTPKVKPQRRVQPRLHVFQHGSHTTGGVDPQPVCETCGDVYGRPQHQYTQTPEAAREVDERRLGEGRPT